MASEVSPRAAAALEDALFVDVREPYEWDAGHIAGSVHIPIGQVQRRYEELERERAIVVVCQVGQRSALVADFLETQGFRAHNLGGGLQSWATSGLPLEAASDSGELIDGWARDINGRRLDGTSE